MVKSGGGPSLLQFDKCMAIARCSKPSRVTAVRNGIRPAVLQVFALTLIQPAELSAYMVSNVVLLPRLSRSSGIRVETIHKTRTPDKLSILQFYGLKRRFSLPNIGSK